MKPPTPAVPPAPGAGPVAVAVSSPADGSVTAGASDFLSTPTFCAAYARKCEPEDFASLEHVLVGAEKLRPAISKRAKNAKLVCWEDLFSAPDDYN